MCIVLDINCLSPVFNKEDEYHDDFKPVLNWIIKGKGKLVYGGKKYKEELRKAKKYLKILILLKKRNKIVEIDDKKADKEHKKLLEKIEEPDFDDPHLIAIIIVSGCKLICSVDKRAYKFIKEKSLYPAHFETPRIYRGKSNKNLLSDKNIADICKPVSKPNKIIQKLLAAAIK